MRLVPDPVEIYHLVADTAYIPQSKMSIVHFLPSLRELRTWNEVFYRCVRTLWPLLALFASKIVVLERRKAPDAVESAALASAIAKK